MLGSAFLEIAIGLTFIYVLLSLVCSGLNEWVAQAFNLRSKTLAKGIESLLTDPKTREQVYHHPLIKSLIREPSGNKHEHPAHIPPSSFALAVLDTAATLGQATDSDDSKEAEDAASDSLRFKDFKDLEKLLSQMPDSELRTALLALMAKSERKIDGLLKEIETWFDGTMDRVSEWYKRKAQVILFGLALLVTVSLNVDTLIIAESLWQNQALRASVVASAGTFVEQNPDLGRQTPSPTTPTPTDTTDESTASPQTTTPTPADVMGQPSPSPQETLAQLQALELPIGWSKTALPSDFGGWLAKFVGLLVTVIAVSQGAPFWFNLLNKLVNLRGTGKVTPEKEKEK